MKTRLAILAILIGCRPASAARSISISPLEAYFCITANEHVARLLDDASVARVELRAIQRAVRETVLASEEMRPPRAEALETLVRLSELARTTESCL